MADSGIHKILTHLVHVHLTKRGEWREVCDAVETIGKGQKEVGHLKHQFKMKIIMLHSGFCQKNSPVIQETRESFNIQCFKSTQSTRSR